jgi:general secretion pathway protein A
MPPAQIRKPVFSISPNPNTLYLTPDLSDGLARIREAILNRQGLCMILGDVGLGKSSMLRFLSLDYEVEKDQYTVSYLHDSQMCRTSFGFLKVIGEDFGISPKRSEREQLKAIEEYLYRSAKEGKNTVLFIDEAQRLSFEILELIRSLLNFETSTEKLMQVVMAGQLQLRDKLLKEQRYEMVADRIVAPLLIQPLKADESREMIRTRLQHWKVENPFAPASLDEIHRLSKGIPRRILILCQQSWRLATDGQLVTAQQVAEAHRKLQITDPQLLDDPAA